MGLVVACHLQVHFQKWKDKNNKCPPRKGEFKVRVAMAYRHSRFQMLELPSTVRDILRKPSDEVHLGKLEHLRKAILSCVVGEQCVQVDCEEAGRIASAIEGCSRGRVFGEVGKGCDLPAGSRVVLESARNKNELVEQVRALNGDWLCVQMFPFGTSRAPLVGNFYHKMEELTVTYLKESLKPQELLDEMLLTLFDAIWLAKADEWSRLGVANLPPDETPELARWFMKGPRRFLIGAYVLRAMTG